MNHTWKYNKNFVWVLAETTSFSAAVFLVEAKDDTVTADENGDASQSETRPADKCSPDWIFADRAVVWEDERHATLAFAFVVTSIDRCTVPFIRTIILRLAVDVFLADDGQTGGAIVKEFAGTTLRFQLAVPVTASAVIVTSTVHHFSRVVAVAFGSCHCGLFRRVCAGVRSKSSHF